MKRFWRWITERPIRLRLLLSAWVALALSAQWWLLARPPAPDGTVHQAPVQSCDDLQAGCTLAAQGQPMYLSANAQPSPLKPFEVRVRGLSGVWKVRFGMVGMEMGPLAFPLAEQPDGTLSARVILPYCVQGRRDWMLWLEPASGEVVPVRFHAAS